MLIFRAAPSWVFAQHTMLYSAGVLMRASRGEKKIPKPYDKLVINTVTCSH